MDKPVIANASEGLMLLERIIPNVHRAKADGGWETPVEHEAADLIVNAGRIHIARRIAGGDAASSAMAYMAVGSVSTAAALANTTLTGEMVRKALAVSSALTNNVFSGISTFGGSADSLTSLSIVEAGIFNAANSGTGEMLQRVTFAEVVLANSDLLSVEMQTNVGSNTI